MLNEGKPPYGTAFDTISQALPQARHIRLPGQGHLAHAEAPDLLAKHLTDALEHEVVIGEVGARQTTMNRVEDQAS